MVCKSHAPHVDVTYDSADHVIHITFESEKLPRCHIFDLLLLILLFVCLNSVNKSSVK